MRTPTASYSPWLERRRLDSIVAGLRRGTLRSPSWVLCPRESLRASLEDRAARAGGAFVRLVDWSRLALALDDSLGLSFGATPDETERALAIERALDARALAHPDLAHPLRSDPFGVALALLRVVDTLRLHNWSGETPRFDGSDRAARLVASHLDLLGDLARELESQLSARAQLDTIARIRRVIPAIRASGKAPFDALVVEGVERFAPLERDLLEALRDVGVSVDVAPWVEGWRSPVVTADPSGEPFRAVTLLDALDRGVTGDSLDGRCVSIARARDPLDEAEQVARWIAECVARGDAPEDFAVHVSAESGALDRMRRALARYEVAAHGVGVSPVRQSMLWQVLRASVRLAWRGVDVVDLATVLSAPGSGIWGSDRDWLCAQLRRDVPPSWEAVRKTLHRATDAASKPPSSPDEADALTVVSLDEIDSDAARAKQLGEVRARVESLIAMWDREGPFSRLAPHDRLGALTRVVDATLNQFMVPMRFAEALEDPRTQTAWIAASQAIRAACTAALERLARSAQSLPPHAPGVFLGSAESLLGATVDTPVPARAEGVALLVEDAFPPRRPRVLVVTGFHRGRFPSPVARALVLGPLERDQLASAGGDLAQLPTDAELGAIAQRETARLLALPTGRLVLVAPRRTSSGDEVEASLAWRDLVARLPTDEREARDRKGIPSMRAWLRDAFEDPPRTERGRSLDAIAALGSGRVDEAVTLAAPIAAARTAARDLFTARFRPEMRFDLGDLVRDQVTAAVYSPRALETLLKCRYSFLTGALLGLRPLHLARSPSVSAQDRSRVTRAALRTLDAVARGGRAPTESDARDALAKAIESEIPWADRGDMRLSLDDLRRTVDAFLKRYLELRAAWKLDFANDAPPREDAKPVRLALPSTKIPAVNLSPVNPRVETVLARSEGEEVKAVVLDLKLGSTQSMTKLREAGFDLDAALVPRALAAQAEGRDVVAFVRLSLSKPDGEVIAGESAKKTFEASATTTLVTVDRERPLEGFTEATLERVGKALEALLDDARAEYAPHDAVRRAELDAAGAKSCEFCAMRLGCRFKMAGGAA